MHLLRKIKTEWFQCPTQETGKGVKSKQNENRRKLIKMKEEINKVEWKPPDWKTVDLINRMKS